MPKDNEVDEKVKDFFERLYGMTFRLFLDPNSEEDEGNTVELRLGATVDNLALFETQDHAVLHPAATVAELRAEVERRKDALAAMSQFAKVAEQRADAAERRVGELEAELETLHFELDMLRGNYEQQTAYTIIHKGVLRYCNSSMRDAYSDETARADAAERRVGECLKLADVLGVIVRSPDVTIPQWHRIAGIADEFRAALTGADPT